MNLDLDFENWLAARKMVEQVDNELTDTQISITRLKDEIDNVESKRTSTFLDEYKRLKESAQALAKKLDQEDEKRLKLEREIVVVLEDFPNKPFFILANNQPYTVTFNEDVITYKFGH